MVLNKPWVEEGCVIIAMSELDTSLMYRRVS